MEKTMTVNRSVKTISRKLYFAISMGACACMCAVAIMVILNHYEPMIYKAFYWGTGSETAAGLVTDKVFIVTAAAATTFGYIAANAFLRILRKDSMTLFMIPLCCLLTAVFSLLGMGIAVLAVRALIIVAKVFLIVMLIFGVAGAGIADLLTDRDW